MRRRRIDLDQSVFFFCTILMVHVYFALSDENKLSYGEINMSDSCKGNVKNFLKNEMEIVKSAYWAKRYRENCRWSQLVEKLPGCFFYWQGYALYAFLCVCAYYIPFFWIPFALFSVYLFGTCGLIIYTNWPRNPHSLVARDYDVEYTDGTEGRTTLWIPRYAINGYYGHQKNTLCYHKYDALMNNSRIKEIHQYWPTYYLGYL